METNQMASIKKIDSIQFDVLLDDGRSATIKFNYRDGTFRPDMAELSLSSDPDGVNIATISFNWSAFEMEIDYHEDVQFDSNSFMAMLGL